MRGSALLLQPGAERVYVLGEPLIVLPPQPDVEVVPLAVVPPVSLQVGAEVHVGDAGPDGARRQLVRVQFHLDLLCVHRCFVSPEPGPEEAGHRAEMAAGADDQAGVDLVVDDPAPLRRSRVFRGSASRRRAPERCNK